MGRLGRIVRDPSRSARATAFGASVGRLSGLPAARPGTSTDGPASLLAPALVDPQRVDPHLRAGLADPPPRWVAAPLDWAPGVRDRRPARRRGRPAHAVTPARRAASRRALDRLTSDGGASRLPRLTTTRRGADAGAPTDAALGGPPEAASRPAIRPGRLPVRHHRLPRGYGWCRWDAVPDDPWNTWRPLLLTRKHLVQAGQLMHDYGEVTAGALDHDAGALVGPSSDPYVPMRARASQQHDGGACSSRISFSYNEATGDLVFTQR